MEKDNTELIVAEEITRKNGEIFANTFQGKLAECAVYNELHNKTDITMPDFDTYELGKWDTVDLKINGYEVSVKSTKAFGNLLLLETKDWNENGVYLPNRAPYDYTLLVRMNPYCEDILKRARLLYSDTADISVLNNIICGESWKYDFAGFISLDELQYIIRNRLILPQGAMLNRRTKMDAENYYVQAGDMHEISEFLEAINAKN